MSNHDFAVHDLDKKRDGYITLLMCAQYTSSLDNIERRTCVVYDFLRIEGKIVRRYFTRILPGWRGAGYGRSMPPSKVSFVKSSTSMSRRSCQRPGRGRSSAGKATDPGAARAAEAPRGSMPAAGSAQAMVAALPTTGAPFKSVTQACSWLGPWRPGSRVKTACPARPEATTVSPSLITMSGVAARALGGGLKGKVAVTASTAKPSRISAPKLRRS